MLKALRVLIALSFVMSALPLFAQAPAAEADLQKTASPELVGLLAQEMGSTPAQAEGAAGALFGLAKTKLKPEEFGQVAAAVPGMDGLLKAAPVADPKSASLGALAGVAGLGGLANVAGSFSKLGLKPEMALKAAPLLTDFVGKKGGAEVGKLLGAALK